DPIRRDLADGYPVICSIDMKALYGEKGLDAEWPASYRVGQVGHYVVVSGLDEDTVTLNDPGTHLGGIVPYSRERFMYALYSYQGYALSLRKG
ncbi:MAG: C39 family peptidase, partial [Chloroflexota bacterium]